MKFFEKRSIGTQAWAYPEGGSDFEAQYKWESFEMGV